MQKEDGLLERDCVHAAGASEWERRMRLHQSWFRRHVLREAPGPNPHARNTIYGSMLTVAAGDEGKNFLDPRAYQAVQEWLPRLGDKAQQSRLLRNMLSSQPMCFNLFAPLAASGLAARFVERMLRASPGSIRFVRMEFEYSPNPAAHLNDRTAFDAFIEFERDGRLGFVGIETKLTEPFSKDLYPFNERYKRWTEIGGWWWRKDCEDAFPDRRYNQLWRNHLLAFAIMHQVDSDYAEGYCAVVYHPADASLPITMDLYKRWMNQAGERTLLDWPLDQVVDCISNIATDANDVDWVSQFRRRYLNLEESDEAWRQR